MIKKLFFSTGMMLSALVMTAAYCVPIGDTDAKVMKSSDPLIRAVVDSYNTKDYAKLAMHFSEETFKTFSQATFDKIIKDIQPVYGRIISADYLGFVGQLDNTIVVYKAYAENSEMLIKLVLTEESQKVCISGVWFG